jgi:molybdopterin synthase sulfur carrier subunit
MTKLLFFGRLRDVAGQAELLCELPGSVATISDVRAWLKQRDEALGEAVAAPDVRIAVNQAFCLDDNEPVHGASEIAFMPPLSGG